MLLPSIAVVLGLLVLLWSADKFVDGAAATATHFGMSPFLVGMLIIGFGTSAPEIVVSIISALDHTPSLALGNAIGSNIANLALILGLTALIAPIDVTSSQIIKREIPILIVVSLLLGLMLWSGHDISRQEGILLLGLMMLLALWSIREARRQRRERRRVRKLMEASETAEAEIERDPGVPPVDTEIATMPLQRALSALAIGLLLLVASSRALVWGAVEIAAFIGVSDLVIGLTVVAIGTSLPELASCLAASRKGENELALGNVVGSNLFNTLAVVGIAASITPIPEIGADVLYRDWLVMMGLTLVILPMCLSRGTIGRISRAEGLVLFVVYIGYTSWLIFDALHA